MKTSDLDCTIAANRLTHLAQDMIEQGHDPRAVLGGLKLARRRLLHTITEAADK